MWVHRDEHSSFKLEGKIEKVLRDVRSEKVDNFMVDLEKVVSSMKTYASPKKERNQDFGREIDPCWYATPVAKVR